MCGKLRGLLAIKNFSEHMAMDGQFDFLVLFGWMPLIPRGPMHAMNLRRSIDKQTTDFQSM